MGDKDRGDDSVLLQVYMEYSLPKLISFINMLKSIQLQHWDQDNFVMYTRDWERAGCCRTSLQVCSCCLFLSAWEGSDW